ncbi:unnamed protein product, partial [Allacma fusca]
LESRCCRTCPVRRHRRLHALFEKPWFPSELVRNV